MLQQILKDMFVDPELLAELSDEQKQILFCKMRQEQLRLYYEREKTFDETKNSKGKNGQNINFLSGSDGKEWVWVMGDHANDDSIEDILQREALEEARKLAEKEAREIIQRREEEELKKLREEEERLIQEKIRKQAEAVAKLEKEKKMKDEEKRLKEEEEKVHQSFKIYRRRELQKTASFWMRCSELVKEAEIRLRSSNNREMKDLIDRRSCEILSTFREIRSRFEASAKSEEATLDTSWRDREERAKQADEEKRQTARVARAEHRRSMLASSPEEMSAVDEALARLSIAHGSTSSSSSTAGNSGQVPSAVQTAVYPPSSTTTTTPLGSSRNSQRASGTSSTRDSLPPAAGKSQRPTTPTRRPLPNRPARPYGRKSVVHWFRTEEAPRGAGIDPVTGSIPTWFHGVITRGEAERFLEGKSAGSFLVRLSERIWGYAVSYRTVAPSTCKHFLVEVIEPTGRYRFFGTELQSFASLCALIDNYKENPISITGHELLKHPCGQEAFPPDYVDLFQHVSEETYSTNL